MRLLLNWKKVPLLFALAGLAAAGASLSCRAEPQPEEERQYVNAGRGEKFDVTQHVIPIREIRGGGPPKDGIPALSDPSFLSAEEADRRLRHSDRLIGVEFNGVAKAYPIRILNWHEIVNDTVGGRAIAVTW